MAETPCGAVMGQSEHCEEGYLCERCTIIRRLQTTIDQLRKASDVGQSNNRDLWDALNLIRQEVEEHGPISSGEHNDPTPQAEAECIVYAIAAIAGKEPHE